MCMIDYSGTLESEKPALPGLAKSQVLASAKRLKIAIIRSFTRAHKETWRLVRSTNRPTRTT